MLNTCTGMAFSVVVVFVVVVFAAMFATVTFSSIWVKPICVPDLVGMLHRKSIKNHFSCTHIAKNDSSPWSVESYGCVHSKISPVGCINPCILFGYAAALNLTYLLFCACSQISELSVGYDR